jgi:hypothetical protein
MIRVFPGVEEVLARFFLPVSKLIREDFPTFDLPVKAYSGITGGGRSLIFGLLLTKLTDLI